MEGFLTHAGFIVPVRVLRARFGAKYGDLFKKLTITHFQKIGPPQRAVMYKFAIYNGMEYVHLPRTLMMIFLQNKILDKVNILFVPIVNIDSQLHLILYDNQILIVNYLCNAIFNKNRIDAGTATGILNLRAGMGKTFVAGGLISRLKMRTLYIVTKKPLASQCVTDLRACLYPDDGSLPSTIVGAFCKKPARGDSSTIAANQGITVIVINSALKCDAAFFRGYSFVILDEVHAYCSGSRREIFRKCSSRVMLGMSATTEEHPFGFDPITHKELAFDAIVRAEEIPGFTYEDVVFDCRAKIINYIGPVEYTKNLTHDATGKIFTHYMHNQFINDPYRLKLAVNELIALYDWRAEDSLKHHIYVFAEEIEILKKYRTAIIAALRERDRNDIIDDIVIPEDNLEMFTGQVKQEKLNEIIKNGRVLFSTFGYAGTGISILKMSAILFLTSRKANMKQILARVLRRGSDIKIPRVIIDIVDKKTALGYQVGARKIAYDFYGFKIENVKIKFSDIHIT